MIEFVLALAVFLVCATLLVFGRRWRVDPGRLNCSWVVVLLTAIAFLDLFWWLRR